MSSQPTLTYRDAVSTLFNTQISALAMLAFVIYDWLINLDEEIRCFWTFRRGHRHIFAALLYGLNRYSMILCQALVFQTVFPISDTACEVNYYTQVALNVPLVFTPAMFSAFRVYALSQSKTMAISTFFLLLGPTPAITVVNALGSPEVLPSPFNCSAVPAPLPPEVSTGLTIASTASNIVGDILVLFVTWRKTYTTYKGQRGVLRGPSLMRVMLYNGSIYFLVITGMNILNVILYQNEFDGITYASIVYGPVSIVLTCRFLLDLRRADRAAKASSSLMAVSSLNFDVVGGSENGSRWSLPAFVASMGSEVPTGLDFVDSIARESAGVADEGAYREAECLSYSDGGR